MSAGRRAMLFVLAFVALWAAVEVLAARVLVRYSPYQVVWTRYVVHLGLMVAISGWRQPGSLWRTRRPAYQLARSLLMLGMPASWFIAQQRGVHLPTLAAVFWLTPFLILGFAALHLGERAPWQLWAATALGYLGTLLLVRPAFPAPTEVVFPLVMAACFSLYVAMTRSLRSESTRANLFYSALGVAVALSPVMLRHFVVPTPADLAVMAAVGILGWVCLYALDRMAAIAPVSKVAPLVYLQLAFTAGFESLVRHDRLGPRSLAALAIIVVSGSYVWLREPDLRITEAT